MDKVIPMFAHLFSVHYKQKKITDALISDPENQTLTSSEVYKNRIRKNGKTKR